MLYALQLIHNIVWQRISNTKCVLSSKGTYTEQFRGMLGIKDMGI